MDARLVCEARTYLHVCLCSLCVLAFFRPLSGCLLLPLTLRLAAAGKRLPEQNLLPGIR